MTRRRFFVAACLSTASACGGAVASTTAARDGGVQEDAAPDTLGVAEGGGVEDVTVGVDFQAGPDARGDAGGDTLTDADANGILPDAPPPCATGSNVLVLPFSSHPQLAMAGGGVLVDERAYTDPVCEIGEIIVVSPSQGSYVALSGACTHECCNLGYKFDAGVLQCVCHYGTFDLNGNPLVSGIPPLQKFAVCATTYGVYVTY